MLTRRGLLLILLSAGLLVAGRLLGIEELYVLAVGAGALVLAALWQVRSARVPVRAARHLHPPRVHAGTDSRVELSVRNVGYRRTPVLWVRDPFDDGRRQARFLLAPLHPGELARAAYRLPTGRRGIFTLGPLEAGLSDAFGLVTVTRPVAPATRLTVYPRVDVIAALPQTLGHDPLAGADHPNAMAQLGEDFYALRPYQVGDDLRRVHWRSTAHYDDLMIRQDEMPWQGRATVLLDVRRPAHTAESLELAVSAAASIVTACWHRRSLVRLITTDGEDSGFSADPSHVEAIMEHLAVVKVSRHSRLDDVLSALRRAGNGGALVAVTAAAAGRDLEGFARLRARFGAVTVVLFEPSSYGGPATDGAAAAGTTVVRVTDDMPFAAAWNRAVAPRRARSAGVAPR